MKELPILFSTEMVRAILEGRKTQTRRVIKPQPEIIIRDIGNGCAEVVWSDKRHTVNAGGGTKDGGKDILNSIALDYSPYQVGDRLWVRETFNWSSDANLLPGEIHKKCPERVYFSADNAVYRADGERYHPVHGQALWLPSVRMPRWASRITLEVTDVRVGRLQDISEVDAESEGVHLLGLPESERYNHPRKHIVAYQALWDSIYAKRGFGWDANPWVWVIEFKRVVA